MSATIATLPDYTHYDSASKTLTIRKTSILDLIALYHGIEDDKVRKNWAHLEIYADEITLDFDGRRSFGIDLIGNKTSLTIIARKFRLVGGENFAILSTDGSGETANIRIQQLIGTTALYFLGVGDSEPVSLGNSYQPPSAPFAVNNTITFNDSPVASRFVAPTSLTIGSAFYWLMVQSFQTGFTDSVGDPANALSIFNWVKDNCDSSLWADDTTNEMPTMGIQAVAMIDELSKSADVNYVPKLSLETYQNTLVTNADTASAIENQFDTFLTQETVIKESRKIAKLMLDNVATMIAALNHEIADTRSQIATTTNQLASNKDAFNKQRSGLRSDNDDDKPRLRNGDTAPQGKLEQARIALQDALKKKKEDAKKQAVMDGFSAVLSLGSAVAGNAAGIASGIGGVVEAINTIIELLKTVNEAIGTITKLVEMADKLSSDKSDQFNTSDLSIPASLDNALSSTQWSTLKENWEASLSPYTVNNEQNSGIADQASNYQAQGNILFIYGQAVTDSSVVLANLQRTLTLQMMKLNLYNQQSATIQSYIDNDQAKIEERQQVSLLLQQRYFDTKRQLLRQILNFNKAYTYWALKKPSKSDTISFSSNISGPGGMAAIASNLNKEINKALTGFTSQSEKVKCHISANLSKTDIETLKSGDIYYLSVEMDSDAFNGYDRVRVEYVEVLFDNLNTPANSSKTYYCKVQNGGFYQDRRQGTDWIFSAEYTIKAFHSAEVNALTASEKDTQNSIVNEDWDSGQAGTHQLLGDPGGYYTPTLFTTWMISLPPDNGNNRSLDWSQVTSIKLIIHGNAMAS